MDVPPARWHVIDTRSSECYCLSPYATQPDHFSSSRQDPDTPHFSGQNSHYSSCLDHTEWVTAAHLSDDLDVAVIRFHPVILVILWIKAI